MTANFRFALYSAVSSPEQAKQDKTSLDDQLATARAFALRQGGEETAGPYILDGYSRTGYEGLAEAAGEIPQLNQLLNDLSANRFDALVMDNFDRLGDIAQMLRVRFKKNRKQIISARQSGAVVPVDLYDPYKDEATDINIHVEGILQAYRLNKLRRAYQHGVPARIERGLHPFVIPFGYRSTGDKQPGVQVPEQVSMIYKMKDWMLEGMTYSEIGRRCDEILPPPRSRHWGGNQVKRILIHPYYAGMVVLGRTENHIRMPRSQWQTAKGRHIPLWDEAAYRLILAEARRRIETKRNYSARYPFSGLTVCAVCGGKINKHGIAAYQFMYCGKNRKHWVMRYEKSIPYLTAELVKALKAAQSQPPEPAETAIMEKQLEELKSRRLRVQEGYESGLYNSSEASRKLNALEDQAETIVHQIEKVRNMERTRLEWHAQIGQVQALVEELPNMIEHSDPVRMNRLLTSIIKEIRLGPDVIEVIWRE